LAELGQERRRLLSSFSYTQVVRALILIALAAMAIWRLRSQAPVRDWRPVTLVGLGFFGTAVLILRWQGLEETAF
jgi:hypothetical protein